MFFSWVGTVQDATAGVTANQSYAVVISTVGAMSAFYGDGKYPAGFRFLPVYAGLMSAWQGTAVSAGAEVSALPVLGTMMNSGSLAFIKIYGLRTKSIEGTGVAGGTGPVFLATMGTMAGGIRLMVLGFIVSTP